jgi:hypothetical protein
MLYRVDYALAVLFAGFLAGLLFSRRTSSVEPFRLARGYYMAIAILLVLRTGAFALSMLTTRQSFWGVAGGFIGDLTGFLFGSLFGLAA